MDSPSRKRKAISLETKYQIILAVDEGKKAKKDIASEFGILPNSLSTILKNRDAILKQFHSSSPSRKRHRSGAHTQVEEALFKWFLEKRAQNVPLSGPVLMTKAEDFAKRLGDISFNPNTGWLERFKTRHSIVSRSISGESAEVNADLENNWLTTKLPTLIKNYEPRDIYNADETGLFYKLLPNKTLQLKGEKCYGGKKAKERLSVLLCANMDGSDFLKPLVIGKYENPRCFKGVKSLPVIYRANKRAWMTSDIFIEWLRIVDRQMFSQKRSILLFAAHPTVDKLRAIKLAFLPPNTTSKLQPMDQGIICNMKVKYRQSLITYILECHEAKVEPAVHVLRAIRMLFNAWKAVTSLCVARGFQKAGFLLSLTKSRSIENTDFDPEDDLPLVRLPTIDSDSDDDVPLADLMRACAYEMCTEDYVDIDKELVSVESLTDDQIIDAVTNNDESSDDDSEPDDHEPPADVSITTKQAQVYMQMVQACVERSENVPDSVLKALSDINNHLKKQ